MFRDHTASMGHRLSHNFLKQPEFSFERRVFNVRIKPGWSLHDGFAMTESFKRIFTMIFTNATIALSTKGQVVVSEVPARIIYTGTSGRDRLQPLLFFFSICSIY